MNAVPPAFPLPPDSSSDGPRDQVAVPLWAGSGADPGAGSVNAVLHEIRHALVRLLADAEPTCIDLAALPFAPGQRERLLSALGRGEVHARISALGETIIEETGYTGVWLVEYRDSEGEPIGLQLEIDSVPRLLRAPPEDVEAALKALEADLKSAAPTQPTHAPAPFAQPTVN